MRLPSITRGAAASLAAVVMVATAAAPTMAASAADSIVPIGALEGSWSVSSRGVDSSTALDNYSVTYVRADGIVAQVGLIVLPSPELAQQVVQGVVDQQKASIPSTANVAFLPTTEFGDGNAYEVGGTYNGMAVQGRLFVDKGTVVIVSATGPASAVTDIKQTADTLATAQDSILPSNA